MGDMYTIIIPGIPIAKKRHRMANGRSYSPQTEAERAVQWEIKRQLGPGFELLKGPLLLSVNSFFPRPKGHYGTGRNAEKLKPSAPRFHMIKPDHDNVCKFYADCMNKLVYLDDSQIVGSDRCGKEWVPHNLQGWVEIRIERLDKLL